MRSSEVMGVAEEEEEEEEGEARGVKAKERIFSKTSKGTRRGKDMA